MKILVSILMTLMLFPIASCAETPPPQSQPVEVKQYLTPEQVISIIQVYGVPHFEIRGAHGSPVGHWAAVCEGDAWRVQGAVVLRYGDKDYYFSTTWQYSDDELELLNCEGTLPYEGTLPTTARRPITIRVRASE